MKKSFILLILPLVFFSSVFGAERTPRSGVPSFKPTVVERKRMDVNTIGAWYRNDGEFFSDHSTQTAGLEWPKSSGVYAVFSSSMWIGAKVKSATDTTREEIRVATVGHFGSELRPGIILSDGSADDYTKNKYRYYKVKPNEDSPSFNADFAEWPTEQGAPFADLDGDGVYNPNTDKPALLWGNDVVYPDMMMFAVYNDADPAYHTWIWGQSAPLGVEVRQLSWAYNRAGPFGQMIFMRFEIINKSNTVWDSAYLCVWSDPDLGNGFDDCSGVDTTVFDTATGEKRNLAFVYNGTNNDGGSASYGANPPAVGYKYFQGPRVPGLATDTARWSGKRIPGYKNLNMSGFNFYCNPGQGGCTNPDWYDPSRYSQTYNVMNGLTVTGKQWTDPHLLTTTKFVFAGDPVRRTGWIYTDLLQPSDVRFTLPAGPFKIMPGDTQQVVVGTMVARGSSNLNSITVLRQYADLSQTLFNNNFKLPPAPPSPVVNYSYVDGSLLLTWDKRAESFSNYDERFAQTTWKFHEYAVYQTNDPLLGPDARTEKIGAWYVPGGRKSVYDWQAVPGADNPVWLKIWEGVDSGIVNHMLLTEDRLTGSSFIPGRPYYFFVTATAIAEYNDADTTKQKTISGLKVLSSPKNVITIIPRSPVEGTVFPIGSNFGDIIPHNRWINANNYDDALQVQLVDPWRTENKKYRITLNGSGIDVTSWNLYEINSEGSIIDTVATNFTNFSGDELYPVISNVMPKVINLPLGVRRATQTPRGWFYNGRRWFTGARNLTMDDYVGSSTYGLVSYPTANNFVGYTSGLRPDSLRRVEIRFSKTNTQKAYRYIDGFGLFPPILRRVKHPEFRPFVMDSVGIDFLYQDYHKYPAPLPDATENPTLGPVVPFTVWEVDSVHGTRRQLDVGFVERNDSLYRWIYTTTTDSTKQYLNWGNVDGRWSPSPQTTINGTIQPPKRGDEVLLIFGTDYSDTAKPIYTGGGTPHFNLLNEFSNTPVMYALQMRRLTRDTTFNEGDVLYIRPNYALSADKVFEFEVKAPQIGVSSVAKQRGELAKIKVVPNPYYASHQLQQDQFDSYVTFTNLPVRCKIRIFNLTGDMVAVIDHDAGNTTGNWIDNSSTRWNLKNHVGIPVSSGMYIAHIEADGIGERIVKFAIFIQEERLDTF
jgi:hypothetical protein